MAAMPLADAYGLPVTAASRVRRRNREDEELEEQGRNDGHPAEEETDDGADDGLPHVDVLA